MKSSILIGTRGSRLALKQTEIARTLLNAAGIESAIKIITTRGDLENEISFDRMEGTGFFTKEIEKTLLKSDIDLAVHSLKDLETRSPDGLKIAALSPREDAADLLIIRSGCYNPALPLSLKKGAIVGTSSPRRKMQLLALRPDARPEDLRGNVPTRLDKLRSGQYDAIIIAAAGVNRLSLPLEEFSVVRLDPREFIPAPGQGALAFQVRSADRSLLKKLRGVSDISAEETTRIERDALQLLEGGCRLPAAVYCAKENGFFRIWACHASRWEEFPKRVFLEKISAAGLAEKVAKTLLKNPSKKKYTAFITASLKGNSYFRRALENGGFRVTARSLIRHRPVEAGPLPDVQWVFFSSKNAVRYFFDRYPEARGYRFAAIGSGTAMALAARGIVPAFTGDSTDTRIPAENFARIAGNQNVLFPQSARSARTVQKHFSEPGQAMDWIIYKTEDVPDAEIPEADVVVFTSPSNAEAYLRRKAFKPNRRAVAMGTTTARKLEELGVRDCVTPWGYSETALADAVMSVVITD